MICDRLFRCLTTLYKLHAFVSTDGNEGVIADGEIERGHAVNGRTLGPGFDPEPLCVGSVVDRVKVLCASRCQYQFTIAP